MGLGVVQSSRSPEPGAEYNTRERETQVQSGRPHHWRLAIRNNPPIEEKEEPVNRLSGAVGLPVFQEQREACTPLPWDLE
ncbi:hypothetical protein NDU88_005720 [Pleurodeles waltl]|uniref:Uncharacterized protein n=1 Tax=Pleurodeles waltl TaxID=8319 RepID=A0AAV7NPV0_PLEWA|nr:hypothetical protein NDU88_005720 [Pleurodeles waltl]